MRPPILTFLGLLAAWLVYKLAGFDVLAAFAAGAFFMEGTWRLQRGYWRD